MDELNKVFEMYIMMIKCNIYSIDVILMWMLLNWFNLF